MNTADRRGGMRTSELKVLCDLIIKNNFKNILELGMANGSSSVAILAALKSNDGGNLTSIDPYQLVPVKSGQNDNNNGYAGQGIENVKKAGFSHMHILIVEPDYIALPKLMEQGAKFDFIFIDGNHSFDYAFLDFFYADLLLQKGGILAFHDSSFQTVYKVCKFIINNKSYRIIGPPPEVMLDSVILKIIRRLKYLLLGRNDIFRERRLIWCSLAAFAKVEDKQCKQYEICEF